MGLEIHSIKKYRNKIIWGIIFSVIAIFVLRVALWERQYYDEKEGSPRATAVSTQEQAVEVDETEITDSDRENYKVAAEKPRFLSIESIGVKDSRILQIAITTSGALGTPVNIYDTGWYNASAAPGNGGVGLYDGHNGGPTMTGVFKRLPELAAGDIITIERGDGNVFKYRVVDSETVPLSEADRKMSWAMQSPEPGRESISLITCTGEWSQVQQTYLSRHFIRAILVDK